MGIYTTKESQEHSIRDITHISHCNKDDVIDQLKDLILANAGRMDIAIACGMLQARKMSAVPVNQIGWASRSESEKRV